MHTKLLKNVAKSLILFLGITFSSSIATAFDSGCKHGTEECIAGAQAARGDWHQSSEHQRLWQYASELAGLPDALSEPFNVTAYTNGSSVNVAGTTMPSLVPAPFDQATDMQSRSIQLADFSQLPDLSFAVWDWASGNETCPLGPDIDPQDCHDFSVHNGVVNSNHFVPQAFEAYKHYHALAMEIATQCADVDNASPGATPDHMFNDYLLPCEKMALLYESVGQHFLQDAWSMGHMWERWGSPNRDVMHDHFNGLAVGATAGLIHGAQPTMEAYLGYLGTFNDALCAPVHEEVRFKHAHGSTTHPATGDQYFDAVIPEDQPANLSADGEFIEQKLHLLSCATQGILEVYRASGELHGSADPTADLLDLSPTSEDDCFGQRATNAAMQKGSGIDVVWLGWWPYHIAIDGYTASTAVLALSSYADNYSDMSWWELWNRQSQYRYDLTRMVGMMELWAKEDPEGTQLASGGLGPMMGIQPNGYYLETGHGVASYDDFQLSEHASLSQDNQLASTAMTRLFQDAYGPLWCEHYSGASGYAALTSLKDNVVKAADDQAQAAACGVCTNVVKRHIRRGTGPKEYDENLEPVCVHAHRANLTEQPGAIVYHDGSSDEPAELAAEWCGC